MPESPVDRPAAFTASPSVAADNPEPDAWPPPLPVWSAEDEERISRIEGVLGGAG